MVAGRDEWMSIDDFLALDRESLGQKYEFRNGQMVAMAGGSKHHAAIIGNLYAILRNHLKDSPCFAFASEMTLKIKEDALIPDLMVTCNEKDLDFAENKTYIEYPKLVIEVLSPSTEQVDRGEKFFKYTFCSSIQEYVLINYNCMLVQRETRKGMQWLSTWFGKGENVEFESIGLTVPVEEIYDRIILPPFDPFRRYRKRGNSGVRTPQAITDVPESFEPSDGEV